MQRRVVGAQLNSLFGEHGIDEIVLLPAKLLGIYLDGIKVENVLAAGTDRREFYARHISKPRGNVSRIINATLIERIEFPQLDYTYRTLDIGQAEIVAAVIEILPPEPLTHGEPRLVQRTIFGAPAIDSSAVRAIEGYALEYGGGIFKKQSPFPQCGKDLLFFEG